MDVYFKIMFISSFLNVIIAIVNQKVKVLSRLWWISLFIFIITFILKIISL